MLDTTIPRARPTYAAGLALAACALLYASRAYAGGDHSLTVYVSPGVVYSGLDDRNGGHAIGGELSVPFALRDLAAGPFTQVQWTSSGPHYVVGAELVYLVAALELGWFVHDIRGGRRGFSGAALFGLGLGWIGPRLSVDTQGDVSVALNLSLKGPWNIYGCHWFRATFTPTGCGGRRRWWKPARP